MLGAVNACLNWVWVGALANNKEREEPGVSKGQRALQIKHAQ